METVRSILISRLTEEYAPPFYWGETPVSIQDVQDAINNDDIRIVKDCYTNLDSHQRENMPIEWHIGRIKYFVLNPSKITPLEVRNVRSGGNNMPEPHLIDGHHRLMAHIVLGHKTCEINWGGSNFVTLDYLEGKVDKLQ